MYIHYTFVFRLCYLHAVCHSTIHFGSNLSACLLVSTNFRLCVCCAESRFPLTTMAAMKTEGCCAHRLTSKTEVRVCNLCNLEKPVAEMMEDGGKRCSECNPLRQRIQRLRRQCMSAAENKSLGDVDNEDMADFYQKHKHTLAKNLKVELNKLCTRTASRSLTIDLEGNGTFLDAVDLRKAYEDCPTMAIYIYVYRDTGAPIGIIFHSPYALFTVAYALVIVLSLSLSIYIYIYAISPCSIFHMP